MEKWFERLSTLDALFLELEDRTSHMHVGAVAVFEGKPPPYADFLALIQARLDQVPRYRQRVVFVPFRQGRPVWIDESQFDLEYHVRHTALPAPGGEEELKRLAGRLFSQALDRDKPLWEMWLVEGLDTGQGNRFAIISKTHHCMLDGISGVDLATVLMDTEPSTDPPPPPAAWEPRPPPTTAELLLDSLKGQITHPLRVAREALEANNDARKLLREIANGVRPLLDLAGLGFAPPSVLNRPIGPHRRFEMLDLPLRKVRESMKGLKESGQAVGAQALTRLGDFAPPTILAQAARLQAVTRFFNLVVTNVPGPQFPLYLLGRRLLSCYPQVPLAAQQTVGIALLSYAGNVGVGLLADLDVRDLSALAEALRVALDELSAIAEAHPRETGPRSEGPPPPSPETDSAPPPPEMASIPPTPEQDPARTPGI
jgi:hypothetical protein